ncbi:MAG: phosphohydrolase, partial [Firmicutes bacterium]|nr:phosphohydrolase [Bacillota bacterium]
AIINNITVDIIENSYGKDYIKLSESVFRDLKRAKSENYQFIYNSDRVGKNYETIGKMFEMVFEVLLEDLKQGKKDSVIFCHHIDFIRENTKYYDSGRRYEEQAPADIVTDYIASMTDSYFVALFGRLFPESPLKLEYVSYFDDVK